MIYHKVESPTPITYTEALVIVEREHFFGYHPAGYGGYLCNENKQAIRAEKNPPTSTIWYWAHWDSCD